MAVPVFFLVLLALVDFSRMLFTYVSLANATREMARVAAIPTAPSANVVAAFNNTVLFLGGVDPATDKVRITVQPSTGSPSSVTCDLPLTSCTVPSRTSASQGWVQISTNQQFQLNPLFTALMGTVGSMVGAPSSFDLTTTTRGFIE